MVQEISDRLAHPAARRQPRGLRAQESLKFDDERSGALGADRLPRRGILPQISFSIA